jgi:exonuclease VII small subunit|tara:strand:- start:126 stop:386 length:261 start_codon:yes stop_codon:yes gene_type:complete
MRIRLEELQEQMPVIAELEAENKRLEAENEALRIGMTLSKKADGIIESEFAKVDTLVDLCHEINQYVGQASKRIDFQTRIEEAGNE